MIMEVKPKTSDDGKDQQTGKFLPGNHFWMNRSSYGKKPMFENGDQLWDACCEYFEWNANNPLQETKLFAYEGEVTEAQLDKIRPMSVRGLCLFLGISLQSWYDWRKLRADLSETIQRVEDVIFTQKFEGASAGLLNATIISRDLGLVDRTEQVATVNLTVASEDAEL